MPSHATHLYTTLARRLLAVEFFVRILVYALHRISSPLLEDDERHDDDVDVEVGRLDLQPPLALSAEEAFLDSFLDESGDLVASGPVCKLSCKHKRPR